VVEHLVEHLVEQRPRTLVRDNRLVCSDNLTVVAWTVKHPGERCPPGGGLIARQQPRPRIGH
jgi:hypothetical protein